MLSKRVLIIGDKLMTLQSVITFMKNDGMDVCYMMSVEEVLNIPLSNEYCLVIMCISSPINGAVEALRLIREMYPTPIIATACKLKVVEKIRVFQAGANACLEQPIDAKLCVAQARSLIRLYLDAKAVQNEEQPLVFGTELIINSIYRHVIIDGEPLELTRTEFDLLYYMAKHPNQIFSRGQLYRQVWGDDLGIGGENTVHTHIGNLYRKLAEVGKTYIQNTRGVGYRFVPPADSK